MEVFLCHAEEDREIVKSIGYWLKTEKGLDVWLDDWCLTPGDSLIEKIGEGIESSDKLVVFLSPAAVESNWVKKEVANGLIMEIAEEKGLGSKFVIPAYLKECKIPILLRDKVYANFVNKPFETAREELYRGITESPIGLEKDTVENRFARVHKVTPQGDGKYALLIEFGVRVSPVEGLHIGIDSGSNYKNAREWFGPPNTPTIPTNTGGVFTDSAIRKEPPIYARKFSSPSVTSAKSFYVYLESDETFNVKQCVFKSFYE